MGCRRDQFSFAWFDLDLIYGLEAIIQSLAKSASRKVGSLYMAQRFLTESILYLYKPTIWPCMEYCSLYCLFTLTSACSTSITMGNVPPSLQISYLYQHQHYPMCIFCASFINLAFFLTWQPFGTPSLMNAFHQIMNSHLSRGGLTNSCW